MSYYGRRKLLNHILRQLVDKMLTELEYIVTVGLASSWKWNSAHVQLLTACLLQRINTWINGNILVYCTSRFINANIKNHTVRNLPRLLAVSHTPQTRLWDNIKCS